MNALELLKTDHQKVSGLFDQAQAAGNGQQKQGLFEQIATELETHTHIEEAIFYPAIQQYDDLNDLVQEAFEEHNEVKTLIREMRLQAADDPEFDAKLAELRQNVEHHVEEEENEMFPQVKEAFDSSALGQLGRQLEAAKREFGKQPRSASSGARR